MPLIEFIRSISHTYTHTHTHTHAHTHMHTHAQQTHRPTPYTIKHLYALFLSFLTSYPFCFHDPSHSCLYGAVTHTCAHTHTHAHTHTQHARTDTHTHTCTYPCTMRTHSYTHNTHSMHTHTLAHTHAHTHATMHTHTTHTARTHTHTQHTQANTYMYILACSFVTPYPFSVSLSLMHVLQASRFSAELNYICRPNHIHKCLSITPLHWPPILATVRLIPPQPWLHIRRYICHRVTRMRSW